MGTNRLCIAGYMGAGKSTVAGLLAGGRCRVIDADNVAKALMNGDAALRRRLVETFGASIEQDGTLSFVVLGSIVFAAPERLLQLNAIVHPPLLVRLGDMVDSCGSAGCILDAALAPLWGVESWFDACLWVEADREIRLHRLLARSPELGEEGILRRMAQQEQVVPVGAKAIWTRVVNNGTLLELKEALARTKPMVDGG
jgi:dephospho-CoA kinase